MNNVVDTTLLSVCFRLNAHSSIHTVATMSNDNGSKILDGDKIFLSKGHFDDLSLRELTKIISVCLVLFLLLLLLT